MTRGRASFWRAQRPHRLTWCLILVGACAGAASVVSGAAVRTDVGKLGAANSLEFYVYAFGVPVYRTQVTGFGLMSQTQALCRAWSGALAVLFTLLGGLLGAAVAQAGRGLLAHARRGRPSNALHAAELDR